MNRSIRNLIPLSLLLFCLANPFYIIVGQTSDYGIIPDKSYLWFGDNNNDTLIETTKPVVQVPPICGKKRRGLGHDLPLPFGTGVSLEYFKQYYDATELQLSNDTIGVIVSGKASVQNSTSQDIKIVFRPDVWLLPFLNVYGIVGYSRSKTIPNFEVPQITINDIPNIGDIVLDDTVTIEDELISMGAVYGGGVNISTGYKSFFFLADYHFTMTKPIDLDQQLESHSLSVKAGILLGKNIKKIKGSFWAGAKYVDDTHKFTGEVNVNDILDEIGDLPIVEIILGEKATYSGKLTPKQKWNVVVGGSLTINKHHLMAIELGYFKREQVSVFYGFRF